MQEVATIVLSSLQLRAIQWRCQFSAGVENVYSSAVSDHSREDREMNTVLITGASSGYGRETARHFHSQGWNVIATMRTPRSGVLPESDRLRIVALDVTGVGIRVGYENPSQFSREYRRQFGAPPSRDAARLRVTAPTTAAVPT